MPILTTAAIHPQPPAGTVLALIPAAPGPHATATGTPLSGPVVAWAQVADPTCPGLSRVDPVFLANGRTWTPDQVQALHGPQATVTITP